MALCFLQGPQPADPRTPRPWTLTHGVSNFPGAVHRRHLLSTGVKEVAFLLCQSTNGRAATIFRGREVYV